MPTYKVEDDVKLIKCVQQHPVLWHKAYMNGRSRLATSIWQGIRDLSFPNKTVNELRVRWKGLRDHYCRQLRRIEGCEGYGSSWKFFHLLKFLDGHFKLKRSTARRIEKRGTSSEMVQAEVTNICWSGQSEASYATSSWEDCESMHYSREASFNYRFRSQNNQKRTRMMSKDSPALVADLEPEELTWVSSVSNSTFLASMVPLLEQLSPLQNVQTRINIMKIITNALRDELEVQ
ncbi:uncharacterized protein LOC131258780 [Anopheles coustani]|uniref:uncharacterized protein LOC131258780 n=1 Tax=Anopheles coustani TaxID=139045 RepID=UPI002659D52E|nr:uncharacterized protein LOC131258780 [Anopheles coustani]